MRKIKTLYKLTREKLFYKEYYCNYCGMMDFDKYFMRSHIKQDHDESEKEMRKFTCKKCHESIEEIEILRHDC